MARLTLVSSNRDVRPNSNLAHRASASEGESARRLMEDQGYIVKRVANGQIETRCFSGETRYLTREGMRTFIETVGTTQMVLDSSAHWVSAEIREFGEQRLWAVRVRRNKIEKVIYATAEHRWFRMTAGESKRRRRAHELPTHALQPGHRLAEMFAANHLTSRHGSLRVSPVGVMHGFTVGDGTRRASASAAYAYGAKDLAVLPFFGMQHQTKDEDRDCVVIHDLPGYFKSWWPPTTESPSYLYGWLAGLFAADGHVSTSGQVTFYSANLGLVERVRDIANRLGVQVYSIVHKEQEAVRLPQGGAVDRTLYSLCFNGESLTEDFFLIDKHRERWTAARERQVRAAPTGWTVVSVEETERYEMVYCAVVPSSGTFTLEDNILTGNCPFHEGPGAIEPRKGTNFYINASNSKYVCQSAGCGERGNLQTLERFFGIDTGDSDYVSAFNSREEKLKLFERLLTKSLREPFYRQGLTDQTIERFRLGFEPEHKEQRGEREVTIPDRYVIPYLEGRRPKFFRYYAPGGDPKWKYTWEEGAESTLFNAQDAMGDAEGRVFLCEGEIKAMLLVQIGYAACAVPGASQWRDEFQAAFTHARQVYVCFDNDNPAFHIYDKPEVGRVCQKCRGKGLDRCEGHNPGQDAAVQRVDQIGWRAKNIVLPLPSPDVRKTDINEFFMRDGQSNADFAELVTGKRQTQYQVQTLAEISESPPEQATFLIDEGILPKGGRLLIAGKPKVGKSIFVDNLALSLAAGIPFLNRFAVQSGDPRRPGIRTMLLDRELSKWSLFKRMHDLMDGRPGYRAAMENLLIDHDHLIRLDQKGAYDTLAGLVEQNGAEVLILDTAYKFLGGDVESSSALMKAFEVLDKLIHVTGVSLVMTHHLKKGQQGRGRENTDVADPDGVAGSFLWTGWPNATILLNYMNRSVENPFNAICTFTAFRDAAAPEPLALYRDRQSISYTAIQDYVPPEAGEVGKAGAAAAMKPTTELVQALLLEVCPTTEDDFMHMASARFGVSPATIKPFFIDALASGYFEKTKGRPPVIKYKYDEQVQTWEAEHGLPERPNPAEVSGFDDVELFDAAGLVTT